jgi:hypothetical protein
VFIFIVYAHDHRWTKYEFATITRSLSTIRATFFFTGKLTFWDIKAQLEKTTEVVTNVVCAEIDERGGYIP